jgi:hypothetical protein
MKNSSKIILDLCGGTGSWSEPYKKRGYDVRLITLPEFDVRLWRRYPEVIEPIETGDIYGVLAAPPCTMFSRARSTAKTPRDFEGALGVVRACMDIVWAARSAPDSKIKFWVLENPMGLLRQFLGNPTRYFRGWEYGDKHVKFTDLWGYFNMPMPTVSNPLAFERQKWASPKKPAKYAHLKLTRADIRAITAPKFARAFMEANR